MLCETCGEPMPTDYIKMQHRLQHEKSLPEKLIKALSDRVQVLEDDKGNVLRFKGKETKLKTFDPRDERVAQLEKRCDALERAYTMLFNRIGL